MPEISCKHNLLFAIMLIGVMLFQPMLASAKCGGVDYSWKSMTPINIMANKRLCLP